MREREEIMSRLDEATNKKSFFFLGLETDNCATQSSIAHRNFHLGLKMNDDTLFWNNCRL